MATNTSAAQMAKVFFKPEWSDWIFERLTDSTSWFRKGVVAFWAAIFIVGIVLLVMFLITGMTDTLYGFLGIVLIGLGVIMLCLLTYINRSYKEFSAKLHGE